MGQEISKKWFLKTCFPTIKVSFHQRKINRKIDTRFRGFLGGSRKRELGNRVLRFSSQLLGTWTQCLGSSVLLMDSDSEGLFLTWPPFRGKQPIIWKYPVLGVLISRPLTCLKWRCLGLLHQRVHLAALTSRKWVRKTRVQLSSNLCHFLSVQQESTSPSSSRPCLLGKQNHCDPKGSFWWESSRGKQELLAQGTTHDPMTFHVNKTRPHTQLSITLNWASKEPSYVCAQCLHSETVWNPLSLGHTSERTHRWTRLLALQEPGGLPWWSVHLTLSSNKPWIEP